MKSEFSLIADDRNLTLTRRRLVDELGRRMERRTLLLRDTLVNYMMAEARTMLGGCPASTRNAFHDLGIRAKIDEMFSTPGLEPFVPSVDRRLLAGGVLATMAALAGLTMTTVLVGGMTQRVVATISTLTISGAVFWVGYVAGTRSSRSCLSQELNEYLDHSESGTWEWLRSIDKYFVQAFDDFLGHRGIEGITWVT